MRLHHKGPTRGWPGSKVGGWLAGAQTASPRVHARGTACGCARGPQGAQGLPGGEVQRRVVLRVVAVQPHQLGRQELHHRQLAGCTRRVGRGRPKKSAVRAPGRGDTAAGWLTNTTRAQNYGARALLLQHIGAAPMPESQPRASAGAPTRGGVVQGRPAPRVLGVEVHAVGGQELAKLSISRRGRGGGERGAWAAQVRARRATSPTAPETSPKENEPEVACHVVASTRPRLRHQG